MMGSATNRPRLQENAISWLLTGSILTVIFLILKFVALPEVRLEPETYEFIPLDIVNIQTVRQEMAAVTAGPVVEAVEPEKIQPRVTQRNDNPHDPLSVFETTFPESPKNPNLPAATSERKAVDTEIQMNTGSKVSGASFQPSNTSAADLVQLPRISTTSASSSSMQLKMQGESEVRVDAPVYEPTRRPVTTIEEKKPVAPEVEVALKKITEFGDDYENLSPIYKELIEWMKRNPRDLPHVVETFMGYKPRDLTSSVEVTVGERQFEIFLVCNEIQYEVRICLVEDQQATLLIDKGFLKRSNYFRIGSVSRAKSGKIFSFGTSQESASDARTVEFYRIFLSWWERVKSNG